MKKIIFVISLFVCCSCGFVFATDADVNYIVLETNVDNINKVINARVAFYIPVADSNNFAGTNYRIVVLQQDTIRTQLEWLIGSIIDSLNIGALIEHIETVSLNTTTTKVQKRNQIDARFNVLKTTVIDKFYAQHDFWGLERIVP
jgi:hypothetical protein